MVRELLLLRLEGGHGYKFNKFKFEHSQSNRQLRARKTRGGSATETYRGIPVKAKGGKRCPIPSSKSECSISESQSSNNDKQCDSIPKEICIIYHITNPSSQRYQSIPILYRLMWLICRGGSRKLWWGGMAHTQTSKCR